MFQLYKTLITTILSILSLSAIAHDYRIADIIIDHPFIYETPPVAPVAGGYLTIKNTGKTDDRLIAVKATFANMIQIHDMRVENDVMRMQELVDGIAIPAGESITLKRGGKHIMFMQLQKPMQADREYAATLVFEKAGEIKVYFTIKKVSN